MLLNTLYFIKVTRQKILIFCCFLIGCTVYYHSPWHRNIIAGVKQRIADMISLGDYKNPGYNKELELVDLWAVYCVIITVVCGSQVWYKEHVSISRGCPNRRKHTCSCSTCIYQLEEMVSVHQFLYQCL